ncbi:uncharacterized protein PG998_006529 [Apiospora kogelbergensis]|uniref:uncharacterized protein n=1 Tax=Apiospora kogelbergensis TaxID=1337665 RepID=UPI0031313336
MQQKADGALGRDVVDEEAGPDDGGGDAGEQQEEVPLRVGEACAQQQVVFGPVLEGLPGRERGDEVEEADLGDDADDEDVPEDVEDGV